MDYTPRPNSLPSKVIQFLADNPDECLSANEISGKFDVSRNNVHTLLSLAVQAGLLIRTSDEDEELVYQIGKGTPQSASKPQPQELDKAVTWTASAGKRSPPIYVDVDAVKIDQGVPLPPSRRAIDWPALLDKLQPTDSFALDRRAAAGLLKALTDYSKAHPGIKFTTRKTDTEIRCWRVQ